MKARLSPAIKTRGVPGFLLWARRDNPALYAALANEFPEVAQFDMALRDQGLSGIGDVLASVGASLKKSASAIGGFVARNALPLATAAVPLIVAKKQADIAKAQFRLAEVQAAPMQTAVVNQGAQLAIPVQYANSEWQQVQTDAGMIQQPLLMDGKKLPGWIWWAAGGTVLLLGAMLYRSRR